MKDSWTGCEDFIAHCCFENHGVEEKSDAKMIKNLLTFISDSYEICSLSFTLIHFRSKYTSSVLLISQRLVPSSLISSGSLKSYVI